MVIPSPNEAKALKVAKEAAKAARKAQFKNENLPVVEIKIPHVWADTGKEIDLDKHSDWLDAMEYGWRINRAIHANTYPHSLYQGPVRRKIIRT